MAQRAECPCRCRAASGPQHLRVIWRCMRCTRQLRCLNHRASRPIAGAGAVAAVDSTVDIGASVGRSEHRIAALLHVQAQVGKVRERLACPSGVATARQSSLSLTAITTASTAPSKSSKDTFPAFACSRAPQAIAVEQQKDRCISPEQCLKLRGKLQRATAGRGLARRAILRGPSYGT